MKKRHLLERFRRNLGPDTLTGKRRYGLYCINNFFWNVGGYRKRGLLYWLYRLTRFLRY